MRNAVERSLFNKDFQNLEYNPSLILNKKSKNIKMRVKHLLKTSKRIDIAVSYAVWSGLSLIYEDLKKFGSDSRILVTGDGLVTDPTSLSYLSKLDISSKIYLPTYIDNGFHLKSYLGEKEEIGTLIVGSANISSRAFGKVHEMAVEIHSKNEGMIIDEYKSSFDELWDDKLSKVIDDTTIANYKIEFDANKKRKAISQDRNLIEDITPNYMQEKALDALKECRKESTRGLVIAATGTGKTYLSAFDCREFNAQKILFLVHNRLIMSSAIETFKKVFPNKKVLELNSTSINSLDELDNFDIVFSTDKSAKNLLYEKVKANYFDYIIYDEAHKIGLGTIYEELVSWFQPKFTLGITATPERTEDPKFLFEIFNYNIPYEIRLLDAMDHELVCPFTYYGYDLDEDLLKSSQRFDYPKLATYLNTLIESKGHYGEKLRGIIFCKDIKEANELSLELNLIGLNTFSTNESKVGRDKIEEAILSLKSSDKDSIQLICVVNKFNEGVDIPDINTIFMLRNTTSSIVYLQQLGRGLRKTNDPHKFVTVFDIIDNSKKNFTIAEVLTGNMTMDKRKLLRAVNENFESVSPFLNVEIEEKAMDKILKSISKDFNVNKKLKAKFTEELTRFSTIPDLLDLYLNENLHELSLLQLLDKNFYTSFQNYYLDKYGTPKNDSFLKEFFSFLLLFVFRSYSKEELKEYYKVLSGGSTSNKVLIRVLTHKDDFSGIPTAIKSSYYKETHGFPKVFLYDGSFLTLNEDIFTWLGKRKANELFLEHLRLIKYLGETHQYEMRTFDLLDKCEFLFLSDSKDCYLNAVGEKIDHVNKKVFCPITISNKETFHDNQVLSKNEILYFTQNSNSREKANEKLKNLIDENYEFCICAKFPHLGYSKTSYFNLGKVTLEKPPVEFSSEPKKFNHKLTFKLSDDLPAEFLCYKSQDNI